MVNIQEAIEKAKNEAIVIVDRKFTELKATYSVLTPEEEGRIKQYKEHAQQNLSAINIQLHSISTQVFKNYLPSIASSYVCKQDDGEFTHGQRVRAITLSRLSLDSAEKSIEKLQNVYSCLSQDGCSLALVYRRTQSKTEVCFVVANQKDDVPQNTKNFVSNLQSSFLGNFPGAVFKENDDKDMWTSAESIISNIRSDTHTDIAMITNVATEKSEDFVVQTIEKLLDGYIPDSTNHEYTLMLLATPKHSQEIENLKQLYSDLYTAISPFASWQTNNSFTEALTTTKNASLGLSAGVEVGITANVNAGANTGKSASLSGTQGLTLTYTQYNVKNTMERIEAQVKRLENCEALGMWDFAAYVLSPDYATTKNIANMYKALMQGEESYTEKAAINLWHADEQNPHIRESLSRLHHPQFTIKDEDGTMPNGVSGSTCISGKEIARALSLPKKSIAGLPVIECAAFGRNITLRSKGTSNTTVDIGAIYHMMQTAKSSRVDLCENSLASHVFITGSTGSGKSNTVYTLLNKLCLSTDGKDKHKFLVIEPAKGEYKEALGGYEDVVVYGTNQKKAELLQLNPFSFPQDIHVLEHIDRLIEIFNACWPMYAAMPAVLKGAIELAYQEMGWNLTSSTSESGKFPTFNDVIAALPKVIDDKGFSKDTQGDYKGALLTRVESLTNGVNGQVLCSPCEIPAAELFDANVIIDISRIGSMETKALLMGILVLKLQEHRMAQRSAGEIEANSGLRHITVLEEAHNLLRRTSSEQSHEGANLQGKSVEMLTNAIAELRSFGEGFVIADQSPGLLDMAVIRNTNTKIIMRLPDESDRVLVGKAAGLNDDQIIELSKLETGVAAVYQNDWLEPVLCKVDRFNALRAYSYNPLVPRVDNFYPHMLRLLCGTASYDDLTKEHVDSFERWILRVQLTDGLKQTLKIAIADRKQAPHPQNALYRLIRGDKLISKGKRYVDIDLAIDKQYQLDDMELSRMVRERIVEFNSQLFPLGGSQPMVMKDKEVR